MTKRWRLLALGAIAGGALLLFLGGAVFAEGFLRSPRRPVPSPRALALPQRTAIESTHIAGRDGARLEAWFLTPGQANGKCVLVLHGIGDSRAGSSGFAGMFLDAGYRVLLPDLRAHGESGGAVVTFGLLERYDLLDWARWMQTGGCTALYGLGESLGAAALIEAAALAPLFRAIAAEGSYSDLRSIAEHRARQHLGRFAPGARWFVASAMLFARLRYGFDFDQAAPVRAIARTQTPVLLIHGLEDRATPPSHSIGMAAANPQARLWLVPGARHTAAAITAPAEFRRRVLDWFATH